MSERILSNIREFLKRVELKGDEAFAYCEAATFLDSLKDKSGVPDEEVHPVNRTED